MMDHCNVRRSNRKRIASARMLSSREQDKTQRLSCNVNLPHYGDVIVVQWVFSCSTLWWRAAVLECSPVTGTSDVVAKGRLRYYKLQNFPEEECDVVFFVDTEHGDLVSTIGSDELSSWKLLNSTDAHDSSSFTSIPTISPDIESSKIQSKPSKSNNNNKNKCTQTNVLLKRNTTLNYQTELRHEIDNLKNEIFSFKQQSFTSSSNFLILSIVNQLKWSLLKKLQQNCKPLISSPSAAEGITQHYISINTPCSLIVFSKLCTYVASPEMLNGSNIQDGLNKFPTESFQKNMDPSVLDVSFVPSFDATQRPSLSASRFHIVFPTVKKLFSVLQLRDDDDYENLLCREYTENSIPFMRLIGVLSESLEDGRSSRQHLHCPNDEKLETQGSNCHHSSTDGKQVNRKEVLFPTIVNYDQQRGKTNEFDLIGSSDTAKVRRRFGAVEDDNRHVKITDQDTHCKFIEKNIDQTNDKESSTVGRTCLQYNIFLAVSNMKLLKTNSNINHVVFQQSKKNWFSNDACYLSNWISKKCSVEMIIPSQCDDEFEESLEKCLSISWKRERPPSQNKWSFDAIHTGNDVPGCLTLLVPLVTVHGMRSCRSISRLLDQQIYNFMPSNLLLSNENGINN